MEHSSKLQEVLYNFKISIRGSLRNGPSIVTWVPTLQSLRAVGENDVAAIIKKHNTAIPKNGQLLGPKAVAVRNLLDVFPVRAWNVVEAHVQELGWQQCCFSDDCLSSRKVLPGYTWRYSASGLWKEWNKMTDEASLLMVQAAVTRFANVDKVMRKKLSQTDLETLAEQATFACGIADAAKQSVPLSDEDLESGWFELFIKGDWAVCCEIESCLQNKDDKLCPRQVKQLAILMLRCNV